MRWVGRQEAVAEGSGRVREDVCVARSEVLGGWLPCAGLECVRWMLRVVGGMNARARRERPAWGCRASGGGRGCVCAGRVRIAVRARRDVVGGACWLDLDRTSAWVTGVQGRRGEGVVRSEGSEGERVGGCVLRRGGLRGDETARPCGR